jgi:hypothetical protein
MGWGRRGSEGARERGSEEDREEAREGGTERGEGSEGSEAICCTLDCD